ncbi:SusC/RagA family TonB-linked outer membrane protein [Rhizosphaericola mali]|uniref:SusC/RagA family TonB-linked outer membrane protein n=1 Tax=Rhizosphaericola mali TaxID=2545455 RepID=A0A5P2GDN5_9BACT|nr:SusC/RagA family TonB-linked outer membrane protein [Rhizosphaericola mali]QES89721.1 SusC/RagA family TonB-linked outer membrane protein [Rhizosphaericola mali]
MKLKTTGFLLVFFISLIFFKSYGQGVIVITGNVKDTTGKPIVGATISLKGKSALGATNDDGDFTIKLNNKEGILVISSIGFTKKEINANTSPLNVVLIPEETNGNEVVVSAFGIKRQKKSLGYSTTSVGGDQFTQSRDVNLGNALTGKVAGVSVANNATGPTGSSRVIIRGNASLTGNNQPLYVIDGIPFDNSNQGSAGQYGGQDLGDGLSSVNPDDIQSIEVLKGVAASALYGYRGGNGAILITTKSGSSHKPSVDINNNFTLNPIYDYRDYQSVYGQGSQGIKPTTETSAFNTASLSWGAKMDGSDAVNFLGNTYKYQKNGDNWKNFYNTGLTNQSSVALSGSSDFVKYRFAISDLYNKNNIPNSNMNQQVFNMNTIFNISKKLSLTVTANYVFEKVKNRASMSDASTNVNATLTYLANSFDVRWLKPRVKSDGTELTPGNNLYFNNPYFLTQNFSNTSDRNRLSTAATLKYTINDWLYAQTQVSRDGYVLDYENITPTGTAYANGGSLSQWEKNYRELNGSFMLGMNKTFGENFTLDANVGGNSQDDISKTYGIDGTAGPFLIPYLYTANNISTRPYTLSYNHYRVNSFFGAANLGYKNFLFLNLTGRQDWFSTLAINSNKYFYPSASLSFVASDAFKLPNWISYLKLRGSYAQGSNGTNAYQTYLTYGLQGYTIDGQNVGYITNSSIPNAYLKPVQIQEREFGMNMQFLNNRFGFDAAYYYKKTNNDIAQVSASSASGYSSAITNSGRIRNQGIEFLLNGYPIKNQKFRWNASFNIAYNDSKVLYLGEDVNSLAISGAVPRNGDGVTISNVVGLNYGQIMGYAYKTDAKGNRIFASDGQAERTSSVVPLGTGVYKVTGGFNNQFTLGHFNLSFLLDFKYGAKVFSGTNLSLYTSGLQKTTLQGREDGFVGKGVTEDGSVNTTSINSQTYFTNLASSNIIAQEFVYDASFIKLRQFSFSYDIPTASLERMHIKGINVGIVGRNLWTIMKHTPNIDPEAAYNNSNGQGLEGNGYMPTRSYGFNVNIKF